MVILNAEEPAFRGLLNILQHGVFRSEDLKVSDKLGLLLRFPKGRCGVFLSSYPVCCTGTKTGWFVVVKEGMKEWPVHCVVCNVFRKYRRIRC